jgi:hypothetical protein
MMTPLRDLAMLPIEYNRKEAALNQSICHKNLEEEMLGAFSI